MKNLLAFWRKDIINKWILVVSVLLLAGLAGFVYLIFSFPEGSTLQGMLSQYLSSPTPTLDMDAVFTGMTQTAIIEQTPAYLGGAGTITPAAVRPTATPVTPQATATLTSSPLPQMTETPTINAVDVSSVKCIPNGPGQTGRVLDILDGVTVKVMLDGLVYNVRYIGLALPGENAYAGAASMLNGQLVWGRDVNLYAGPVEKDALGQLLRYVVIDEKFVNLELLQKGLVTWVDDPSGADCSQVFSQAEQAAKAANLGLWHK